MPSSRHFVACLPALLLSALLLTACGDSPSSDSPPATLDTVAATATTEVTKPSVVVPAGLPTELVVSDLATGSGARAATGDTVIVHYVGVRSVDGDEFDNSYDRGAPLEVPLGSGRVIAGWEQGLVGVQQGGRRQLDIPADLAYGDTPPAGGPILPGDALTFVVDVVAVLPASDAADEPADTPQPAGNTDVLVSDDLIVGTGAKPADGLTVAMHIVSFRADTAERLASDWGSKPLIFDFTAQTEVYPGLIAAVRGMQVGGRRLVQIPYSLMFDGLGSAGLGLPAGIDLVVVIDLVAVY